MECKKCGTMWANGIRFCPMCGEALTEQQVTPLRNQPVNQNEVRKQFYIKRKIPVSERKAILLIEMNMVLLFLLFQNWIAVDFVSGINTFFNLNIEDTYNLFSSTKELVKSFVDNGFEAFMYTLAWVIVCLLLLIGAIVIIENMLAYVNGENPGQFGENWCGSSAWIIAGTLLFYVIIFLTNTVWEESIGSDIFSLCSATLCPLIVLVLAVASIWLSGEISKVVYAEKSDS